jgi:transposase
MSGDMTKVFVADTRRRWSDEEKQAIIEESLRAPVARVAKRHGVASSLLFRWRKQQGIQVRKRALKASGEKPAFIPVALPGSVAVAPAACAGKVEIVLGCGAKLAVDERTDLTLLKRVIAALS